MLSTRGPLNAFMDLPQVAVSNAESGPLAGASLAVKDIFDVAGYPTGCGNPDRFATAVPSTATAHAVQALLDAGARFAGKTQTDELAFSLFGRNAHLPFPVNPKAPDRITGGSSSGSAAAVAGGLADIATGSDTGGSIRAPAAFCGLIGLRATHGAISLEGTMPLAPSFDTFGWFARDVELYETVAEVLLGAMPVSAFGTESPPRPLRLAALDALVLPEAADEYTRIAAIAADVLGAPREANLSHDIGDLYCCFRRLQAHEAWQSHGKWISAADRRLGPGVKDRFDYGASLDGPAIGPERQRRGAFRTELVDLLGTDAVLVMPTVPGPAPMVSSSFDELDAYRARALHLLCLSGLSGLPQITLPLGLVAGAPFGISLLGPAGSDLALVRLARTILESRTWTR